MSIRARGWLAVVILGLGSTGCVSRYDPSPRYLVEVAGSQQAKEFVTREREPEPTARTKYGEAVAYAEAMARAYRHELAADAGLSDAMALVLLPLGAAGIGLGISGATTETFIALGMATATGLGIGTWFRNPQRRDAFAVGYQALWCVVEKAPPARFVDGDTSQAAQLDAELQRLGDRAAALARALESVEQLAASDEAFSKRAAGLVTRVRSAQESISSTRLQATSVVNGLRSSGPFVYQATEKVRGYVTAAAVRGQGDINSLQAILQGTIQATYQDVFGTLAAAQAEEAKKKAAEAKKAQEEEKDKTEEKKEEKEREPDVQKEMEKLLPGTRLFQLDPERQSIVLKALPAAKAREIQRLANQDRELDKLGKALAAVMATLEHLQTLLVDLNYAGLGGEVAKCLTPSAVLAARRESPLIMRPIVVELAVGDKDPGKATVFVTGGITSTPDDYRHEITGPDVEKVTVDAKTVTGGRQYVVTVPPKTGTGTYVLIVRDLIGTTGVSRINVRKAE